MVPALALKLDGLRGDDTEPEPVDGLPVYLCHKLWRVSRRKEKIFDRC